MSNIPSEMSNIPSDPTPLLKAVADVIRDHVGKAFTALKDRILSIEEQIKALPEARHGRDGIDGKDGPPGIDGKDGRDGVDGKDGEPGQRGKDGADGTSVTIDDVLPHFQQAFDKWALDFERRAQDIHTRLIASFEKPRNGQDGRDGADGLGFDDLDVQYDGDRTFIVVFERGEQRKEFGFKLPLVLERGIYKTDHRYERGDAVTFDGSYWIAQVDEPQGKPGQSGDWRLAVKKGRDGKGS